MDDADVMDVVEGRGDLKDDVVQRVPILPIEELRDPLSGEVLHREVRKAVVQKSEVVDLDDAGVLELGQRGELALKLKELLLLVQLVAEDLQRLVAFVRAVEDAVDAECRRVLQDRPNLIARLTLQL